MNLDTTEIHYITYDPEAMWDEMVAAYVAEGGDVLYPGDEKEIFLRSVLTVMVLAYAGVDNALRMQTLRYAVGDYLDIVGENRFCPRIEASAATGTVKITFQATGKAGVMAAGTSMTPDGERFYTLTQDVVQTGYAQEVTAKVECSESGSYGNGITSGTQMQLAIVNPAIISIIATEDIAGGEEREDDETYRERIRMHGLASITTGPAKQYETVAMGVTSEIIDAKALNNGDGVVLIVLLLKQNEGAGAILKSVQAALNPEDVRPLTDSVSVVQAKDIAYTLNVKYKLDAQSNSTQALSDAVNEYQDWQDNTIGRAFNPDRLIANLYKAGATRVIFGTGSNFGGDAVEYTEIAKDARCKGTISLAVMT